MSDARWELVFRPTAKEMYEAMVAAGQASLRLQDHLLVGVLMVFICFFAPLGATFLFWVLIGLGGGPAFSDLPVATIPVTFFIFGALAFGLFRQSHFMMAQVALRSEFGRGYSVVVHSEGIILTTGHSTWNSGWGDVAAVRGGKQTIAVCISAIVIPLPRRAFLGPQDADDALVRMQRWQEAAA